MTVYVLFNPLLDRRHLLRVWYRFWYRWHHCDVNINQGRLFKSWSMTKYEQGFPQILFWNFYPMLHSKIIFYQFSSVLLFYCTIILVESAVLSLYILIRLYLSCPVWNKFRQIRVCHTYMDICGMSQSAQERDFIVKTRESHLSIIG